MPTTHPARHREHLLVTAVPLDVVEATRVGVTDQQRATRARQYVLDAGRIQVREVDQDPHVLAAIHYGQAERREPLRRRARRRDQTAVAGQVAANVGEADATHAQLMEGSRRWMSAPSGSTPSIVRRNPIRPSARAASISPHCGRRRIENREQPPRAGAQAGRSQPEAQTPAGSGRRGRSRRRPSQSRRHAAAASTRVRESRSPRACSLASRRGREAGRNEGPRPRGERVSHERRAPRTSLPPRHHHRECLWEGRHSRRARSPSSDTPRNGTGLGQRAYARSVPSAALCLRLRPHGTRSARRSAPPRTLRRGW